MCGRITYVFSWGKLRDLMGLATVPVTDLSPRFNVAPTQVSPVIRVGSAGREGVLLRWGLVPAWSDDPAIGGRMINARAETISEKPAYRRAFDQRRCLVPVSGFYEWRASPTRGAKTPYWIGRADREPFALGGVWERATRTPEPLETFTIITTAANDLMAPIHERMPLILPPEAWDRWLAPGAGGTVADLLSPASRAGFVAHPIGTRVNSPKHDDPSILADLPGAA
ncbi:MAG: DUF159 family protein [Phycisphaerae bacterium]|nr:MAG: DUF159 family protein [Phycisphaerae bacterium]